MFFRRKKSKSANVGPKETNRADVRENVTMRVAVDQDAVVRPWVYTQRTKLPEHLTPSPAEANQAIRRIKSAAFREVNLSAGGAKLVEFPGASWVKGDRCTVLLSLDREESTEVETIIAVPSEVVWAGDRVDGKHVAFNFSYENNTIHNYIHKFVQEQHRKRLQTKG